MFVRYKKELPYYRVEIIFLKLSNVKSVTYNENKQKKRKSTKTTDGRFFFSHNPCTMLMLMLFIYAERKHSVTGPDSKTNPNVTLGL